MQQSELEGSPTSLQQDDKVSTDSPSKIDPQLSQHQLPKFSIL